MFSNAVTNNRFSAPTRSQYTHFINGLQGPLSRIDTVQEAAMALAQFIHESGGLKHRRELNPGPYIDDNDPGYPNQRYFGRGYIQLTWVYNYRAASAALFHDDRLVRNPGLVEEEDIAWDTAFWFWGSRVHDERVRRGHFGASTVKINGAYDSATPDSPRYRIYGNVRRAFGLQGNGDWTA